MFELASGYALFEKQAADIIGQADADFQDSIQDLAKFGKFLKLKSFLPFKSAADALQNCNDVSEGICNANLKNFLEMNLPQAKKSVSLGVDEKNLAGSIKTELGIECVSDESVRELVRGIRLHINKIIKPLSNGNLEKAQLGLGHSFSRSKVKFNVNRADNMIIQAICMLDQLDKDINTFAMRIREWYSWHFPEMIKIVSDNLLYAKLAKFIKNKSLLTDAQLEQLEEICGDATKAKQILDASRASMGTDISEFDMINIESFASRVISLAEYRKNLHAYLQEKMSVVAPNLAALIGEVVGARLISHAGSLTNLSKYPASTLQILGAEKALFRALKTKGKTPKYGLIFHSSFIGRAGLKNKGRISRYLANKCSIASRIDCFSDAPTTKFGEALKGQVEDRLSFYETGAKMKTNEEVMQSVLNSIKVTVPDVIDTADESSKKEKKIKKKDKKDKKKDKN